MLSDPPRIQAERAVADLAETIPAKWRGFIDDWDPRVGIHGWALRADAPLDSIRLELVVGDTPFATVDTGETRSDIDSLLGVRVRPGFKFPASVFARLARLRARRRDALVRVRFRGTQTYLIGKVPDPTVAALVDAWHRTVLASFDEPVTAISTRARLLGRLAALRTQAEGLRDLSLRPATELEAGQIEAFYPGAGGQLWFSGWMTRTAATEFSALIIDRQKFTVGAATVHVERQDLASRYVGVVGVLSTAWTPPAVVKEFFIHAGSAAELQLRVTPQTRVLGFDALLAVYREAQLQPAGGSVDALGSLLLAADHWVPGNAEAAGIAAAASLDRVLMLPGFGCLVEGWALCPAKRVRSVQMKIADTVLVADAKATYFKPRRDLEAVYAGGLGLTARAGFITALRGDLPPTISANALLKVIYADGSCSVHTIAPALLHRLDPIADSAEVLQWFPSLRQESFYPALVAATRLELESTSPAPQILALAPASQVLVLRLPAARCNQRLCEDFVAQLAAQLTAQSAPPIAVCLVADDHDGSAAAKRGFHELKSTTSLPLSFMTIDARLPAFAALPLILARLQANRFVYVDGGALLTAAGASAAVQSLRRGGHAIHYFQFVDATGSPDRLNGALSSACFGWTTAALFEWLPRAARLLRGVRHSHGLPPPLSPAQVFAGAALRIEATTHSPLADMLDDDLLALAARGQILARS